MNECTRTLAHKVKSAFVSIKRELQGRKTHSKLAPVNQRVHQLNSIRKELFQTPGGAVWKSSLQNSPKRKERSPLSTDEAQATNKASLGGKAPQIVAYLPGTDTEGETSEETRGNEVEAGYGEEEAGKKEETLPNSGKTKRYQRHFLSVLMITRPTLIY